MKNMIALILAFALSLPAHGAEKKISELPLVTGSAVGTNDYFPFVSAAGVTKRVKVSELANVPSLLNPSVTSLTTSGAATFGGAVTFSNSTATTVPYLSAGKVLTSSAVTPTELGYSSGVTSSLCGVNQSCTQTNKTFTSPTINAGALSGTFSGDPTFSGTPVFSTGGSLSGTFSGTPTFSGDGLFTSTGFVFGSTSNSNRLFSIISGTGGSNTSTIRMGTSTREWEMKVGASPYTFGLSYVGTDAALSDIISATKAGIVTIGGTKLLVPDGSAAAPSLALTNSSTTGFYREGSNQIGIATAGGRRGVYLANGTGGWLLMGAGTSAEVNMIGGNANDGNTIFAPGTSSTSGGIVKIYGTSHATKPDELELVQDSTVRAGVQGAGNFYVGSSGSASSAVLVAQTKTDPGGYNGVNVDVDYEIDGSTSAQHRAIFAQPYADAGSTATMTNADGGIIGVYALPGTESGSAGVITSMMGFKSLLDTHASGTTVTYGVGAALYAPTTASKIANNYGLWVQDLTTGSSASTAAIYLGGSSSPDALTADYAIYSAETDPSYFAGPVANKRSDTASTTTIAALTPTSGFHKLTGSTATTIQTITAGIDGQRLTIYNATGQNMTILHDDGATGTAANRITTMTGASVVTTGNGACDFIYDTGSSRWINTYCAL